MIVLSSIATWWADPSNEFFTWLITTLALPLLLFVLGIVWNSIIKTRPNSARDNHEDPKGKREGQHRLYYTKLKMNAVGYDDEFCKLNEFLKLKAVFQWCLVKGEGGTGKSKLCYDFMRKKRRKWWKPWGIGWEACMPVETAKNYTREKLDKCTTHLPRKTLFILDYAEYSTKEISDWMSSLPAGKHRKKKIRVLLIQRRESTSQEFRELCSGGSYQFSKSPIDLNGALDEDEMKELIGKYIKKHKKKASQSADEIYTKLVELDSKEKTYVRPLYALMLVDALAENEPIAHAGDILKYVYGHEVNTIKKSLYDNHFTSGYDTVTAKILIAIATMIGRIPVEDTCNDLKRQLPKPASSEHKRFSQISVFNEGSCEPIEPDIIGAYYVLKCIEEIEGFSSFISYAWRRDENRYMRGFMTRLMQECNTSGGVFDSSKLDSFSTVEIKEGETEIAAYAFKSHTYIKKLIVPSSVKHIGFETFCGCSGLTEVVFSEGSQLESIGIAAFYGCSNLKQINLPNTLTTIGSHAFEKCPLDGGVAVPTSIKNAGKFAFFGCGAAFPDGFDETLKAKLQGGETVEFGRLIWDVLEEREYNGKKRKLIITHDVIEKKPYDTVDKGTDWHDCSLRAYLNSSKGFLSKFTSEELGRICLPGENGVQFSAEDNSIEGYVSASGNRVAPVPGKATVDKVFLLSTKELTKYYALTGKSAADYLGWLHENGIKVDSPDEEYLVGKYSKWFPGVFPSSEDIVACDGKESWWWWLRSPGYFDFCAAYVSYDGALNLGGDLVDDGGGGVRPALWLNL